MTYPTFFTFKDKELMRDILAESFDENKSVNFVVKQDKNRKKRIRLLMEYSINTCADNGALYFNREKNACALILNPSPKKNAIKSSLRDLKLAFSVIGLNNIIKTLKRETFIKKHHPKEQYIHLWFIGVNKKYQGQGFGSKLLKSIINKADLNNQTILLETSTLKNIPWYENFGFSTFEKLDLGYDLYLMRRKPKALPELNIGTKSQPIITF